MAKSITSEKFLIANARASFLEIVTPKAFQEGQTKKFQATALLDPSDAAHAIIIADIKKMAADLCARGGVKPEELDSRCFGMADKHPKKSKYDGYKGMFYVALANESRPGIANRRGTPVVDGEPQFPYSGCYANFKATMWLQDNKWGKRINGNLIAIQFAKDGTAFGRGPVNVEDEFEALPEEAGAARPAAAGATASGSDWD